jgi:hypothetical protein
MRFRLSPHNPSRPVVAQYLLFTAATCFGHFQGATTFKRLCSIHCKWSYLNGKMHKYLGCSPQSIFDLSKFFYSPTDAQVNCLKNNFKIYNKIDIKTAPTCFGAVSHTIIRERITRAC